jgi:putative membrane protein
MNKGLMAALVGCLVVGTSAALAQNVKISPGGRPEQMNKIPPKNGLNTQDRAFVMQAAHINMGEVELGKLAQRRGGAWAREYGSDMVHEHSMALEELKKAVRGKNVSLPNNIDRKHQMVHDRLSRLSGAAFDNAYRAAMVSGHGEAAQKFAVEIKRGRDSMVRNYAVLMLPGVKLHQKLAQQRKTMKNP